MLILAISTIILVYPFVTLRNTRFISVKIFQARAVGLVHMNQMKVRVGYGDQQITTHMVNNLINGLQSVVLSVFQQMCNAIHKI